MGGKGAIVGTGYILLFSPVSRAQSIEHRGEREPIASEKIFPHLNVRSFSL